MPLAEPPDDEAVLRGAGVEPWQQLATAALEFQLEITRVASDVRGINARLLIV